MKKKKALLFTFTVLCIGFAGGLFTCKFCTARKSQVQIEAAEEKIDLKKDIAKIRALQKEIMLYADKAAEATGAIMAYGALKEPQRKYGISFGYEGEQEVKHKEYYLANPEKIPFYKEEMGETKRRNAMITARDKKEALEKELKEFVDKKRYIIDRQNLDLDAKYWAGRVLNDKDVTFEELATYSVNWIMDGNLLKKLMMTIKYYVDAGHVEPLTKEERETYDRNSEISTALLRPGEYDEELIAFLSEQDCIDILAEHYALYHVKHDWSWDSINNNLYFSNKKLGYGMRTPASGKILAKSKEIVESGKARWLSLEETAAVDACMEEIGRTVREPQQAQRAPALPPRAQN